MAAAHRVECPDIIIQKPQSEQENQQNHHHVQDTENTDNNTCAQRDKEDTITTTYVHTDTTTSADPDKNGIVELCNGNGGTTTAEEAADFIHTLCRTDSLDDSGSQQMLIEEVEEEDDVQPFEFIQECHVSTCWRYKYCAAYTFVILIVIAVAASVALVVIAVLVVRPFLYASNFATGKCYVMAMREGRTDYTCSCGKGCNSKYPCVHITISLMGVASDGRKSENATIHENEITLHKECSFYPPCKTSSTENVEAVKRYANKYGTPGITYPCLYNPNNHAEVIRTRRFHLQHVVHGVVWSSVLLLVALALLLAAIVRRRRTGCAGL